MSTATTCRRSRAGSGAAGISAMRSARIVKSRSNSRMTPILIVNTGSATFKWALFSDEGEQCIDGGSEEWGAEDALRRKAQIEDKLRSLPPCRAVGHRVVHGGSVFSQSIVIDDEARRE